MREHRREYGRERGQTRKSYGEDSNIEFEYAGTSLTADKKSATLKHKIAASWNPDHAPRKQQTKLGFPGRLHDKVLGRAAGHVHVPPSVPYTTPASEFLFGKGAVEAAIRCNRRQLYKLYIYQSVETDLDPEQAIMQKLAVSNGVPVKIALGGWDRLFDSVSNGRSHNGYVLEASPIPQLPITSLEMVDDPQSRTFRVALDAQSKEEIAVNGSDSYISRASIPSDSYLDPKLSLLSSSNGPSPQYPLLLLLDGIVDPNNVGSIIRSAYYLGVDGIILAGRNSAPLNPTVSKTAAGAIENTTFLTVRNDHDFVRTSQANGWRFLAADSPGAAASSGFHVGAESPYYAARSVLHDAPTILMLGNESDGLLKRLKTQADATISIPGSHFQADLSRQDPARVDSLNVGVAASLLIEMLLRVPLQICWNSSKQTGPREAGLQATSSFDFN